jgi:hypothetical protein
MVGQVENMRYIQNWKEKINANTNLFMEIAGVVRGSSGARIGILWHDAV